MHPSERSLGSFGARRRPQKLASGRPEVEGCCPLSTQVLDSSSQPPYYFLFYSANNFATGRYAVGVARAITLFGPYHKRGERGA